MFVIVQITTTTMEENTKSSLGEQVNFFLHEAYGLYAKDLHPKCKYEWVHHSGYRFSLDGCPISMPCEGIRELVRSLYQCHRLYSLRDNAPAGIFDNSTYKYLNTGEYETVCLVATVGKRIKLNIIANGKLFDILIGDEVLQYGCTPADVWGILYRGNVFCQEQYAQRQTEPEKEARSFRPYEHGFPVVCQKCRETNLQFFSSCPSPNPDALTLDQLTT